MSEVCTSTLFVVFLRSMRSGIVRVDVVPALIFTSAMIACSIVPTKDGQESLPYM